MRRTMLVNICQAVLGATLLSCVGTDDITRPDLKTGQTDEVPRAGSLSRESPRAGALSTTSPSASRRVGSPGVKKSRSSGNASAAAAVAPAVRIVWQNTTTGDRSLWLMDGTSYNSAVLLPNVPTAWSIAGTGDFNADGQADIVWQNTSTGDRSIWFMNGNAYASAALLPNVPTMWSIAGVGDFNADGKPDLVWQNTTTGERSIWFMKGSIYSSAALLPNVPTAWKIVAVGDFNADAKPDLVWQSSSTGESSIWFMNGATYSSAALLPSVPTVWRIAATADFDGDTDPDLVWQNVNTGERSIWLMNGASFAGAVILSTVPTQWSIAGVMGSVGGQVAGNWVQLGPSISGVTEVALASDGQSLYRFYCKPLLSDPQDEGQLDKWNGTSWVSVGNLTHECHHPDVEVDGTLWVAGFADDDPDYGFASNANGNIVIFTGLFLVHQWGMHVAIAQGRPYEAFAATWSDGKEYPYNMLHVISPIPPGNRAELTGGWGRYINFSISNEPALAGDASGWYAVTRQQNVLFVRKGYYSTVTASVQTEDIGPGFSVSSPVLPEISIYTGRPTVAWLETSQTQIWVARFDGTDWIALGAGEVTTGYIGHVRQDALQSNLYVLQVNSAGAPRLGINRWNGVDWAGLPDPADPGDTPTSTTGDIAAMSSGPVVAYVSGGVMKIKQLR